jgi:hypothetical protein
MNGPLWAGTRRWSRLSHSRKPGWDLAAGPDKTVWHCYECGIGTAPCKHAQDRGEEHGEG